MTPFNDVLGQLRKLESEVVGRIRELEPLEQELADLRGVADRLGIDVSNEPSSSGKTPGSSAAGRSKAGKSPARRRRGSSAGSRAEQVAKLVEEQPGITVPELGAALKVDSTGLYRVVQKLEQDGRVVKEGRRVQPAGSLAPTSEPAAGSS